MPPGSSDENFTPAAPGAYSGRERAALAWTETVAAVASGAAADEACAALLLHFTESEATFLDRAITTINACDRRGVALRFAPLTLGAPGN